jgi:hypothetical protein
MIQKLAFSPSPIHHCPSMNGGEILEGCCIRMAENPQISSQSGLEMLVLGSLGSFSVEADTWHGEGCHGRAVVIRSGMAWQWFRWNCHLTWMICIRAANSCLRGGCGPTTGLTAALVPTGAAKPWRECAQIGCISDVCISRQARKSCGLERVKA